MKPLLLIFIIAIVFSKNAISQTNAEQTTYLLYDASKYTLSLSDNTGSIIEIINTEQVVRIMLM